MLRHLTLFAVSAVLVGCSGAWRDTDPTTGGGGTGGSGGGSAGGLSSDGEALPDSTRDDDVEDEPTDGTDSTDAELVIDTAPAPDELLDVALDESTGSSSSALSSDCPENRHLEQYDGPASWLGKYGVQGLCVASRYACRMPTPDPDFRRYENPKDSDGAWPIALGIDVL